MMIIFNSRAAFCGNLLVTGLFCRFWFGDFGAFHLLMYVLQSCFLPIAQ